LGTDAAQPVNPQLLNYTREMLGGTPAQFMGRYFKGPGNTDGVQYQPAAENPLLHGAGMKLMPFARQTNHVNGSLVQGQTDARHNVDAYFAAIPAAEVDAQGGKAFLFLDIEPPGDGPDVSVAYYQGWAGAVLAHSQGRILPCAYLNRSNNVPSLQNIQSAMRLGAECHGLMVASYIGSGGNGAITPRDWTDKSTKPPLDIGVPILAWQFWDKYRGALDASQVNPALAQDVLAWLLVPPAK
jgi:hypothetical protein